MRNFLICLLVSWAVWASPPPGGPPADARAAYAQASEVFTGTIVSVAKDKLGYDSRAQVAVKKRWKGKVKGVVAVSGEGGPTHPARIFKPGQTLLFYLGPDLHADSYMNRVSEGAQLDKDVKELPTK